MGERTPHAIALAVKLLEQLRNMGMIDGPSARVCEQVLLADISDVGTVVIFCQQVVEWLVAARADFLRNGFVPFFAVRKDRVDIENHAAKVEHLVTHNVANAEARLYVAWRIDCSACLVGKEHSAIHGEEGYGQWC